MNKPKNIEKKDAVSRSRSMICSTAAAGTDEIQCADCGCMMSSDQADFAEGDGGMIPDRWFCHSCQADDNFDSGGYDYDDWDRTDPNLCEQCGGDLDVYEVCNDCDV